jgi:hypothetical protein
MCIISSKSQRNTRRAPYHQRKETKKSIYNLLSSYDDHHHNIWTSQERRSKTIIPDPHMYIIPEWKKTEKENVAFDDDMVEYIWINHRVDMALLTKWHQQKRFFYSCCSMNCIHTTEKKELKALHYSLWSNLFSRLQSELLPVVVGRQLFLVFSSNAPVLQWLYIRFSVNRLHIFHPPTIMVRDLMLSGSIGITERKRGETRKKS